jgi:hypothetical protein
VQHDAGGALVVQHRVARRASAPAIAHSAPRIDATALAERLTGG